VKRVEPELIFFKKSVSTTLSLLLLFLIVSCSAKNTSFIEAEPELDTGSVVYVYRPDSMSNIMVNPEVLIDGKKQQVIKNNSHFYVMIAEGKYEVKLQLAERYEGVQKLDLNFFPGQVIYIRVNTSLKFEKNKPYSRSFDIEVVDREIAINEINKTGYIGQVDDKEVAQKSEEKTISSEAEQEVSKDQFSISKTRNPFSK